MTRTGKFFSLIVLTATAATVPAPAQAQDLSPGQFASELDRLKQSEVAANARAEALEERVRKLESMLSLKAASDDQLSDMRARAVPELRGEWIGDSVIATRPAFAAVTSDPPTVGKSRLGPQAEPDRKAPAPAASVEAVTREKQGYFGNRFTIEPAITYSHFDDARINLSGFLALDSIFLGTISLDDVSADIFNADVTARYSLSNSLQFDVNVPYLYRKSSFSSGGAGGNSKGVSEATRSDHGLGDVSIGASYRLMHETNGHPDVVVSARVKAPTGRHPFGVELIDVPGSQGNLSVPERLSTGSGVWGASVGISALKTIDPMVVYGSVTYFRNFQRAFSDIDEAPGDQPGSAKLGSALQFGAGVAFALNEKSSLNFSYTQRLIGHTQIRRLGDSWQDVAGSQANVSLLNIGATFSISRSTTLITNLGVGLTNDSPNMVVSARVPVRF